MEITCSHCGKTLRIPDEKVPERAFALNCPKCKKRFKVDPADRAAAESASPAESEEDAAMSFAGLGDDDGESSQVTPPPDLGGDLGSEAPPIQSTTTTTTGAVAAGGFRPLRMLQPAEKQLLDHLIPVGGLVDLTGEEAGILEKALDLVGMHEVQHYDSVEAAAKAMTDLEMGILVLRVEKASAPPFDLLEPIHRLPMPIRRRTLVALLADNIRSHDGQVAFFLQVNCTISSKDMAKLPDLLRRAMLYHLKLYRHWEA